MLETSDLYRSYGHFYLQRTRPAIQPLGEARSNWDTFRVLAQAMGLTEPIFHKAADEVIDDLLATPSPWRDGIDRAALEDGRPVRLTEPRGRWLTPSGKIEIENRRLREPLPVFLPTHSDRERLPLRLQTAPALYGLNSSFGERADLLRHAGPPTVQLAPDDAAARHLADGQEVVAWNDLGEVTLTLRVTANVPNGVAVIEGVRWLGSPERRGVNALTAQRLTDAGAGSTFYDNRIDVKPAS
jgi:anaerobic selenocysteine-containing dehydrogenase